MLFVCVCRCVIVPWSPLAVWEGRLARDASIRHQSSAGSHSWKKDITCSTIPDHGLETFTIIWSGNSCCFKRSECAEIVVMCSFLHELCAVAVKMCLMAQVLMLSDNLLIITGAQKHSESSGLYGLFVSNMVITDIYLSLT